MNQKDVSTILSFIKEAYNNFQVTPTKIKVWYLVLSDLPYEDTKNAVLRLILTHTFPPSIAEIRQAVFNDSTLNEVEALDEVVKALKKYGAYEGKAAMNSMSPLTRKVVEVMGWQNICLSESPEFWRNEFIKLYQRLLEREKIDNQLPSGLKMLKGEEDE